MTSTQEIKYKKHSECNTNYYTLHIAGDYDVAKQYTREFTFQKGACIQLTKVDYCYTGGLEEGLTARIIAYPRFCKDSESLYNECLEYANGLAQKLCQKSFTIEGKETTVYFESNNELHKK